MKGPAEEPKGIRTISLDEALWQASCGTACKLLEDSKDIVVGVFAFRPGQRVPKEGFTSHQGTEVSFVLSGEILLGLVDNPERQIKTGELVIIPKETPHYSRNDSPQEARILWMIAPAVEL